MLNDCRLLALIPARGGSKGIPKKNLQPVGNTSLVERALFAAMGCAELDRILISTDSEEIRETVNRHGPYAPFRRPEEIARDNSPALAAIQHALEWAESTDHCHYDCLVFLEPTCPFRLPVHILEAVQLTQRKNASSVMSLVEVGDPHPIRIKKVDSNQKISPFCIPEPEGLRRQDQEPAYIRNGAVYVYKRETIKQNRLWGDNPYAYIMDKRYYSVNIDESLDLLVARAFYDEMKERGKLEKLEPK